MDFTLSCLRTFTRLRNLRQISDNDNYKLTRRNWIGSFRNSSSIRPEEINLKYQLILISDIANLSDLR